MNVLQSLSEDRRWRNAFKLILWGSIALISKWDRDITSKENYSPIPPKNIDLIFSAKDSQIKYRNVWKNYILWPREIYPRKTKMVHVLKTNYITSNSKKTNKQNISIGAEVFDKKINTYSC